MAANANYEIKKSGSKFSERFTQNSSAFVNLTWILEPITH